MRKLFAFLLFTASCFAFEPWYTGTVLENSGYNQPARGLNLQSFTTDTVTFGQFSTHGKLIPYPEKINTLTNALWLDYGLTSILGITVYGQFLYTSSNKNTDALYLGPTQLLLSLMVCNDNPETWQPAIRLLSFNQFPTTPKNNLPENKILLYSTEPATQTGFVFIAQKMFFRDTLPTQLNWNLEYYYQVPTRLKGVNMFGGDHTTDLKANFGGIYSVNFGVQMSLSQKWALCSDINYQYTEKFSLSGKLGSESLAKAQPNSQLITITPGFEYNTSENFGILGTLLYTPWGTNNPATVGALLSINTFF